MDSKGFSLIEFVVVLVIIGLLLAGVTSGSYLLKVSNLQAVLKEVTGYKTILNVFYEKDGRLPGALDGSFDFRHGPQILTELYEINLTVETPNVVIEEPDTYKANYGIENTDYYDVNRKNNIDSKLKSNWFAFGYRINGNSNENTFDKNSIAIFSGEDTVLDPDTSISFSKPNLSFSLSDALFLDNKTDDGNLDTGKTIGVGINHIKDDKYYCGGNKSNSSSNLVCAMFFEVGI